MEAVNLKKKIKGKLIDTPKNIFNLFLEEYKDSVIRQLVLSGKLVNEDSIKNELVYTILNENQRGNLYRNNKIQLNGDKVNTSSLFDIIWKDDYEKRIKSIDKELIASFLGEEHYSVFQYSNKKHIKTGRLRVGGIEGIGPYSFIHSLRITEALKKKNAPRVAIDLGLVHDIPEESNRYRSIKLNNYKRKHSDYLRNGADAKKVKKIEEDIISLEDKIKSIQEYQEIKELFPNETEYSDMLVKFLDAITQKPGEKYNKYISRLIGTCEKFYTSNSLIKNFFYILPLDKLEDDIDNTKTFRELRLEKQLERLDKNYILLEKISEFAKKYKIKHGLLLDNIRELFEVSIRRIDAGISGYWTDTVDTKIRVREYQKPLEDFKKEYKRYGALWRNFYPGEKVPSIYYNIEFKDIKIN